MPCAVSVCTWGHACTNHAGVCLCSPVCRERIRCVKSYSCSVTCTNRPRPPRTRRSPSLEGFRGRSGRSGRSFAVACGSWCAASEGRRRDGRTYSAPLSGPPSCLVWHTLRLSCCPALDASRPTSLQGWKHRVTISHIAHAHTHQTHRTTQSASNNSCCSYVQPIPDSQHVTFAEAPI